MKTINTVPSKYRRITPPVVIILCWLLVCAFFLQEEYRRTGQVIGVPLDDSWIHFRYAQNLHRGYGLSFNPGEPSTGSTSPLWVIVLTLCSLFTGEFLITSKVIGALCLLATALLTHKIALDYALPEPLSIAAALCTLLSGRLTWCALSGMETSIFTLASTLAIARWRPVVPNLKTSFQLGILFGLTTLLRPEGWALFALAVTLQLGCLPKSRSYHSSRRKTGRLMITQIAVYGLIVSIYVGFCLLVTGRPFPNTFYAKTHTWNKSSPLAYAVWVISLFALDNPIAFIFSLIGILAFLWNLCRRPASAELNSSLLGFAWLLTLPIAYGVLAPYTTIYYFRYLVPLVPFSALAALTGIHWTQRLLKRRLQPLLTSVLVPLVLIGIVLGSLPGLRSWASFFGRSVANIQDMHVAAGRWLAEHSRPTDRVATHDVGAIAYLSDRYIVDLAGLISPSILPPPRDRNPDTWDQPVFVEMQQQQPQYIVILEGWFPTWAERPELEAVHTIHVTDNVITTSQDLVIYRCRW